MATYARYKIWSCRDGEIIPRALEIFGSRTLSLFLIIFSSLSHVRLCVGVTAERKLMLQKGQASWPNDL